MKEVTTRMKSVNEILAEELGLRPAQVENALRLRSEGGTIPFIARYRKEQTGEMNEIQLRDVFDRCDYLTELGERKATILKSIEEQGRLTDDLREQIAATMQKTELEDLYRPFRPKKRTRASVARERGLAALADLVRAMNVPSETAADPEREASRFINSEKEVATVEDALAGASDILAEEFADRADLRHAIREYLLAHGAFVSTIKGDVPAGSTKFEMYRDFRVSVKEIQSHTMLAMRRGEDEGVLSLDIDFDAEHVYMSILDGEIHAGSARVRRFYEAMLRDAFDRLMKTALIGEVRFLKKEAADLDSARTFAANLRDLLLSPPAGAKSTLGVDPGFRTGCKIVAIDRTGKLLEHQTIYPHQSDEARARAATTAAGMITKYTIELVAIGNGTASRETSDFLDDVLASMSSRPVKVIVNESGASVYSASDAAIEEFPDLDVTIRGAVSIGRRLQDPLAELVKIDPKSIGVGQYQHDVDQHLLKKRLEETVESCVNFVGVDVNTASRQLLSYVAGVNSGVAKNIVAYRDDHGSFKNRQELTAVPKLGQKTFEQAAGFLRIRDGDNPLDNSAVHPESYAVAKKMLADLGLSLHQLGNAPETIASIDVRRYVSDGIGEPTLRDIIAELQRPGRDPRKEFRYATFKKEIKELKDLAPGMVLEGVVTNVANFGAFVDIGVHQDGLVHVSQIADRFVADPKSILKVGQIVTVRVLEVNEQLNRISLSMKSDTQAPRGGKKGKKGKPEETKPGFTLEDLKAKFRK